MDALPLTTLPPPRSTYKVVGHIETRDRSQAARIAAALPDLVLTFLGDGTDEDGTTFCRAAWRVHSIALDCPAGCAIMQLVDGQTGDVFNVIDACGTFTFQGAR